MATSRPLGKGMAQPRSISFSSSAGMTFPLRVTFSMTGPVLKSSAIATFCVSPDASTAEKQPIFVGKRQVFPVGRNGGRPHRIVWRIAWDAAFHAADRRGGMAPCMPTRTHSHKEDTQGRHKDG